MRSANAVGRRLMKMHRSVSSSLQAKQRCLRRQLTPHEDASTVVVGEVACGPLAPISIGNIMNTIEPLMGEADRQVGELLGGAVYNDLRDEVSRVSAKIFCAAQELSGRVPIDDAIELLKLYKQLMRGCGGGYNEARGLCGTQFQLDRANPDIGRRQAWVNSRACVAAAKVEKQACAARLAPRLQAKRAEIGDALRALNEDARDIWRWIQVEARLLQPKYDALMAQMRSHLDRYSELEGFKRLQRGLLGDQHATYNANAGERRRQLSETSDSSANLTAEVVQIDQVWLLEELGMSDFAAEDQSPTHTNSSAPRILDVGYGNDDDDTVSACDEWMLDPPAWFLQCPDICVPFCCPRQGCCSGCEARSSCTGTFLQNVTRTETCYSCFTGGCELGGGEAPATCVRFDDTDGGTIATGAHQAPSLPRLSGADSGIMAFGPSNPRDSKPDRYLVLISSIRMCRQLVCNGFEEGTRSVTVPGCQASGDAYCVGDEYTVNCIKGSYAIVPSSCVSLYSNPDAVVSPSWPRLTSDGNGNYLIDSLSQCGRIRELQQQGMYLDLADPRAGLDIGGVALRGSDAGNYSFMQIQLAGDYIVQAEVPLTSGARLYTQPCGCEACPNTATFSASGQPQPNPDVMCGGGGCSSCSETPLTEFSASSGAMKDEFGPQVKMCANDLRQGPASEVSVRQYAQLEFVLNDPIVVTPTGIETQVFSEPNATAIANRSGTREECVETSDERLGVGWASTMRVLAPELDDLVSDAESREERAVLQASPTGSFGHVGLQVWEESPPWCATWVRDILNGSICEALYDARVAELERGEVAQLVADGRSVMSAEEAARLPARLTGMLNRTLDECTLGLGPSASAIATGFTADERAGCIEEASDVYGAVMAGRVIQRVELLRATGTVLATGAASPIDFTVAFGPAVCAELPTPARDVDPEARTALSQSVTVDLAYVLDGTVRGHVAPNRLDQISPGQYALSDRPLEATRRGGAISDGVNAILVDDVQISAVVRMAGESLLRYRQVISVGASCVAVRGHPCAYPTSDFRSAAEPSSPSYRTSSCQREAEHGGAWYDTDVNLTAGLQPSKPFQVLVRRSTANELNASCAALHGP